MTKPAYSGVLTLCSALLLPLPTRAADVAIPPQTVIDVITADWNNDGAFDRAILVESPAEATEADILIYLSNDSGAMNLAVHKKGVAWRGHLWGAEPGLELNGKDSLVINSANEGIGRNRWRQKLTLIYRDKSFLIAGYTYDEFDTLEPKTERSCDINLLTGKGVKNNKPFKILVKPVTLANWSASSIPGECR